MNESFIAQQKALFDGVVNNPDYTMGYPEMRVLMNLSEISGVRENRPGVIGGLFGNTEISYEVTPENLKTMHQLLLDSAKAKMLLHKLLEKPMEFDPKTGDVRYQDPNFSQQDAARFQTILHGIANDGINPIHFENSRDAKLGHMLRNNAEPSFEEGVTPEEEPLLIRCIREYSDRYKDRGYTNPQIMMECKADISTNSYRRRAANDRGR